MATSRSIAPLLLVAGLALAGCGGSGSSASSSSPAPASASAPAGPHNAADVTFAQQMVPHHTQALAMVELTKDRDLDAEVSDLVAGIGTSQRGEVATMSGWLRAWGEKVPTTMSEPMNGMLSADELGTLRDTDGDVAFQRLWLLDMVQHHQGAIPMAQTEIKTGANPSAIKLAEDIVRTQERELGAMGAMIGQ